MISYLAKNPAAIIEGKGNSVLNPQDNANSLLFLFDGKESICWKAIFNVTSKKR